MTHDLEESKASQGHLENLASRDQREILSLAHLDHRGLQDPQVMVMKVVKGPQDHLDPQDPQHLPPSLEHTGPIILSVYLDLQGLLVHLEVLVCPLGSQF